MGIFGVLGVVFVVLKLTEHVAWSWLWVTSPFWGGLALSIALIIIAAVTAGGLSVADGRKARKRIKRGW